MRRLLAALLCCTLMPTPAQAWGPTGHRVTGAIAEHYLSGVARAQIQLLIGDEPLAQAATWPDDMKSDPAPFWQSTASPFHYVTVPTGSTYAQVTPPPEGDSGTALKRFTATLKDPNASLADKRMAVRFIIHIVGDLHQPLHAGRPGDRGGNSVQVTLFRQQTNLHSVWDSGLIDHLGLSYSEYSGWLVREITPQNVIDWSDPNPETWIAESVALRETIYPATANAALSFDYAYQHQDALDGRLRRAGVRIAAYLNKVYG